MIRKYYKLHTFQSINSQRVIFSKFTIRVKLFFTTNSAKFLLIKDSCYNFFIKKLNDNLFLIFSPCVKKKTSEQKKPSKRNRLQMLGFFLLSQRNYFLVVASRSVVFPVIYISEREDAKNIHIQSSWSFGVPKTFVLVLAVTSAARKHLSTQERGSVQAVEGESVVTPHACRIAPTPATTFDNKLACLIKQITLVYSFTSCLIMK